MIPEADPSPHARLTALGDPVLARLAAGTPLPPLEPSGDVFHDLVGCLVEQQHPARSTKGTFQKALDRAGLDRVTVDTFPRFEERGLDGVRLSGAKQAALAAVVDAFRAERPDWTALPDAEVRARLGALRGVGPWTVDMLLLYTLGRPDVFPAADYHLRKAMAALYGIAEDATRERVAIAEGWRPHRSLGTRFVLAWRMWQREALP